jgi:mono/diheme cytochrome c family protein
MVNSAAMRLTASPMLQWGLILGLMLAQIVAEAKESSGLSRGEAEGLFAAKIQPLLEQRCHACHGGDPDKIKGEYTMLTGRAMRRGGQTFQPALVSGKPDESPFYLAITWKSEDLQMPPKENDRMTPQQIGWIRDWIMAGAPWPKDMAAARLAAGNRWNAPGEVTVPTSGGLSDAWTQRTYEPARLWAYQPLRKPVPPGKGHPVDAFLRARFPEGLHFAPRTKPRALLRRVSFNMTGLPPRPDEMRSFLKDSVGDPDKAWVRVIDRLLDSPHHGEQMARHWLDVVRYADSAGFANDYPRPNAWRYRDYVIRSFNEDKPYHHFVREQLAGDTLKADDPEHLIATGFLRMGPWEHTSMSVFRVTRQQWLDDVTDSVGQTFLGHALQCAKCHDHKFDPLPTRDYYRMRAAFSTTQFAGREAPFLEQENTEGFDQAERWTRAKLDQYRLQHSKLKARVDKLRKQEFSAAKVGDNGLDPGDENSLARMNKNIQKHVWELDKVQPIVLSVYTGNTVTRNNIGKRLLLPKDPWAKGYLETDHILTGGNVYAPGEPVTPGALSAVSSLGGMPNPDFPEGRGNRRLALADWIVDPSNPLTARVIANRVWAWHFGRGLAGNPNNLGVTGKLPTHPALLDWLATTLVEEGWSIKRLHRIILSSEAYRSSIQHPEKVAMDQHDPERLSYAVFRPRRLVAEEFRDAMLAASGELNRQLGGVPCRPDMNPEVAMQPRQIMGGTASVYEPDPLPMQRNRRSIYAEKTRGLRDPFLEMFNQPGPDKSCELRETSTIAPQALTLMNSGEIQDRSLAFASRVLSESTSDTAAINQVFLLALGRSATPHESRACMQHWRDAAKEEEGKQHEPHRYATRITRTVMAEKTGEPYTFVEYMPVYESYVPDLQSSEVDARTRALAQVCLVVFNSNEFAYLQ